MSRFVIFDLDDTLVDSAGAVDAWFAELVEQRELGPGALEFLRAEGRRPVSPQESFQAIVERFNLAESPAQLQHAFRRRQPQLARPFDGAVTGLEALRDRGWRTALLTNGPESQQRPKLGNRLGSLFDVLCFTYDEAVRKPDPAAFELVAERAGVKLAGAWMVGDSLSEDLAPARSLGMSTIWVSNTPVPPDADPACHPDEIVPTITEAFAILSGREFT